MKERWRVAEKENTKQLPETASNSITKRKGRPLKRYFTNEVHQGIRAKGKPKMAIINRRSFVVTN